MNYAIIVVPAVFVLLFLLERRFPLRRSHLPLLGRVTLNIVISLLAFGAAALLVRPAIAWSMGWADQRGFGLIHTAGMPPWLGALVAFLLMDLAFYYWHVLNHHVPLLWRFHNVHHVDPELDVSTGFRFHFVEVGFSAAFRVVQVTLIGVSLPTFIVYEAVFQACTLFHHSNVRMNPKLERLINLMLVTPRMHGIHHSQVKRETNSNYSVVFSWWDRLHRSVRLNVPQDRITIGIAGYSRAEDNRFISLLLMPFRRQRDYWKNTEGRPVERDEAEAAVSRDHLSA